MRNLSSAVLSLAAMVLSSFTTYLSFFDARYTLTASVADVSGQTNRGYGSNGEQRNVNFRFYVAPSVILSNRGTRPLVITDVALVPSSDAKTCVASGDPLPGRMETLIIEPGSVRSLPLDLALPQIEQKIGMDEAFSLEDVSSFWCIQWVVFDPNGRRHEPMMPAFTADIRFGYEDDESHPSATYKLDFPKGPTRLLSRGLF